MIGKTEGRTNVPDGVILVECFRCKKVACRGDGCFHKVKAVAHKYDIATVCFCIAVSWQKLFSTIIQILITSGICDESMCLARKYVSKRSLFNHKLRAIHPSLADCEENIGERKMIARNLEADVSRSYFLPVHFFPFSLYGLINKESAAVRFLYQI